MTTFLNLIVNLLRHNITVTLPILVLLFKFGVRWVTREPLQDVFKSLLTVPLDLVYIAVGMLFAGLARTLPQFAAKHSSDRETDLFGAILLLALLFSASIITKLDRQLRICWQKAFAAIALLKDSPQLHLPQEPSQPPIVDDEYVRTLLWMLFYWAIMILLFFTECTLSVLSLGVILKLVT